MKWCQTPFAVFTPDCCHLSFITRNTSYMENNSDIRSMESKWLKNSVCVWKKWFEASWVGCRSRDWAVWLNHAVCSDLFSSPFHPPLFMSALSTRACTHEKGHTHTQNAAFKGDQWEFFCIWCERTFHRVWLRLPLLRSALSCVSSSAAFME